MTIADRRTTVVAVAVLTMVAGLLLRLPVRDYAGPEDVSTFTAYSFDHLGSYSDVASLYMRDLLWEHPTPYVDRELEYPVLTGAFIWLTSFVNENVWSYLVTSWLGLALCGAVVALLLARRRGSDPWVFALAPALAFYVVLNWDLLSLAATVAALVFFEQRRDVPGAAALVLAIWTKLFPLLLFPLMLAQRWSEGDRRAAARLAGIVGLGSVIVNLPILLAAPDRWMHVFIFNRERPREVNIWNAFDPIATSTINLWSGILIVIGVAVAIWWVIRAAAPAEALAPTFLALLAWAFFLGKVYSPQYSLWIVVLLAFVGASRALSISFIAVDVGYFAASFAILHLATVGASDWFFDQVLWPAALVREAVLLVVAGWALRQVGRTEAAGALKVA